VRGGQEPGGRFAVNAELHAAPQTSTVVVLRLRSHQLGHFTFILRLHPAAGRVARWSRIAKLEVPPKNLPFSFTLALRARYALASIELTAGSLQRSPASAVLPQDTPFDPIERTLRARAPTNNPHRVA